MKIINISSDAKEIGDYCFKNCEKLENINLPNFELLSNGLFENCYSLKNIIIPNSVKIIKGAFFLNCTSIEKIILSKNITSIGGGFVNGCESLEAIYYEGSIEQWNEIEKLIDDSWVETTTIIYDYNGE